MTNMSRNVLSLVLALTLAAQGWAQSSPLPLREGQGEGRAPSKASAPASTPARAAGGDYIGRTKSNQERARELTSELVAALLESHIQQLEDNKLQDLPLYKDLIDMRGRMSDLAAKMMPAVIDLLTEASEATGAQRTQLIGKAQDRMRDILLKLLAERERIRIRRQQALLIERLTEIIGKQKAARTSTLALGPTDEQAIVVTLGSQGAVQSLYVTFADMLKDVATWSGDLGAIAGEDSNPSYFDVDRVRRETHWQTG